MKLEAFGESDVRRICDDEGYLLALAMRYTSGFWAVHERDTDKQLCRAIHKTPRAAMKWFEGQAAEPAPEPGM